MKRSFVSSPSTSSSSCIGPTITHPIVELNNKSDVHPNKSKRVRAKKVPTKSAAISSKSKTSIYRGVTRHRCTGRYEAHLWDKTIWNSIQTKRGKQRAYDDEEDAGRTYDLAALKYWGPSSTITNFPVESYAKEIEEMEKVSKYEYLASLRRQSSGFSRGVSKYRGVARHHQNGRWEARIGRVSGNKYLYLGTYNTQEEAAEAYDKAAIKYRGAKAITNFNINNYNLDNIVPDFEAKQEVIREKKEPNPKPFINVQADGAGDSYQDDEIQPRSMIQDSHSINIMEPIENHEYPWNICMDTGFDPHSLPNTHLDTTSEWLGWLDHKIFTDDDIACVFNFENNFTLEDATSGTNGCMTKVNVVAATDLKGKDLSTSNSSSSLSTMASVCSNI
ncbi:hypothetical protein ACS0TY_003127 [Phlomoides rotata]